MKAFPSKLKELIEDNGLSKVDISKYLGLNNKTKLYAWLNGKNTPRIETILKFANLFNCSIDYLVGRTDNFIEVHKNPNPDFAKQLKKVLKACKVSQYRLLKDNIVSQGHLNSWFNDKMMPNLDNIIKLADYLNISIDYLVGRE